MQSLDEIKSLVEEKFGLEYKERFCHTLGVVQMAKNLAEVYHVDPLKAQIAGYLHDFCKYDDPKELEKLLTEEDSLECRKYPVLYHSYGSAAYYKKYVGTDEDIYQAIRNHVFGRIGMSRLEEIILISDYTEENRKYLDCIKGREILFQKGIDEAIYFSSKRTIEFLIKRGIEPHPLQKEVLNLYERKCENANNGNDLPVFRKSESN